MNIGLIGSGGREHALCQKLYESRSSKKIFCFPGNAGTADIATNTSAISTINNTTLGNFTSSARVFEDSSNSNNGIGYRVLESLTTGSYNSASGSLALVNNTTGSRNNLEGYILCLSGLGAKL